MKISCICYKTFVQIFTALGITLLVMATARPEENQVTFSAKNHNLDNNDNFSADGRFLVYDTRETVGPGIENCQSIEMVALATGEETVLYSPETIVGVEAAPGVGAASFSPVDDEVVFIHGPPVEEVDERGYYGKPNRTGAAVRLEEPGAVTWVDRRDVATDRPTVAGAHRGGTHRHEYSLDGARIGFTYDDFLLQDYGRTIGYMESHPDTPEGATHYVAMLVPVAPEGAATPGDIVYAAGDSWVGRAGTMRAFVGKVMEDDGTYQESLFIIDVPKDVDITTADAGTATRFPSPPEGVSIRRITQGFAQGIVRGTRDGDRIAYYGRDTSGRLQVFVVDSDGSDGHEHRLKRPIQVTSLALGAGPGLRWHPSGKSVAFTSDGGIVVACVEVGPYLGKAVVLTAHGDAERINLVWSPDGKTLAYNKAVPTLDADGNRVTNYAGEDFLQIFTIPFSDADGDGIADGIKQ